MVKKYKYDFKKKLVRYLPNSYEEAGIDGVLFEELINDPDTDSEIYWESLSNFFVSSFLTSLDSSYRLFAFFISTGWSIDSKLIRYKGLEGDSKLQPFVSKLKMKEVTWETNGLVRFAGLAEIDMNSFLYIVKSEEIYDQVSFFMIPYTRLQTLWKDLNDRRDSFVSGPGTRFEHIINLNGILNLVKAQKGAILKPYGNSDYGGVYLEVLGDESLFAKVN